MTSPAVSILVVSYNTRDLTLECLRSVRAETLATPFEVIVLDNGSTDGSADAISAAFPDFRLIRSPENLGFAGGNNAAARHATGEYLLLLNPDTVVLDRAIDELVDFARATPKAGIWGGRTLDGARRLDPTSCWRRPTAWSTACISLGLAARFPTSSIFNSEGYGGWSRDTPRQVDIITGCFLLIRRSLWKDLGGFDSDFFMYAEEADLCLRAAALGARPRMTPRSTIVHYGGASSSARVESLVRLLTAKRRLLGKHLPWYSRSLGLAAFDLWPLLRVAAYSMVMRLGRSHDESLALWQGAWSRRRDWRSGRFTMSPAPVTEA